MVVRMAPPKTAAARVAQAADDLTRETPLHAAATTGDRRRAESLLRKGADPAATDIDRQTPLHSAALKGCDDVAELLLRHGTPLDASPDHDCRQEFSHTLGGQDDPWPRQF